MYAQTRNSKDLHKREKYMVKEPVEAIKRGWMGVLITTDLYASPLINVLCRLEEYRIILT